MNAIRLTLILTIFFTTVAANAGDPLPSWNEGATKNSILKFVDGVTTQGGQNYVPPAERIATFDNDGTLWAENPFYFQILFSIDRVKELADTHPEWSEMEPYASVIKGDMESVVSAGEPAMLKILMAANSGMTNTEYYTAVRHWIKTAKHPASGRLYSEMIYQPMLELMTYLRSSGFKTYIVSGGGVEFMRVFSEEVYGIPPEQVVGTRFELKHEIREGKPVLVRLPKIDFVDDREGKPVGIQNMIGRRPIAAFGNSDGDLQMLEWTAANISSNLSLIVHHTDAEREWAYDRNSKIGQLNKALDIAIAQDWTIVDMKKDWNTIYPWSKK